MGVRYQEYGRFTLDRDLRTITVVIQGRMFDVRIKTATNASGEVVRAKPEFDDLRAIAEALSMPARRVADIVTQEAQKHIEKT